MSNLQNNRLSAALAPEAAAEIRQMVRQIEQKLPFLLGLTPEERKALPKINRSNKLFVDETLQACADNGNFLPPYLDVAEMRRDYELYRALGEVLQPLAQLYEKLRDTQILAGSEAFSTALMAYRMLQMAARSGMPGLDTVVSRLSERFASQGPSGPAEAEDGPEPGEEPAAG
jgi:hypothetical protein